MVELLFGIEPFYVLVYLIGGSIVGSGIAWKIIKILQKVDTRGLNQNKAFCIMAKHMDDETERLHPEVSPHKIKPTIDTILNGD